MYEVICVAIVILIILFVYYYKTINSFDTNYEDDYIAAVIKPGQTWEYYYYSMNREPTILSHDDYSYEQIENDPCRGTCQLNYNFSPQVKVKWDDSENGNPDIMYVV